MLFHDFADLMIFRFRFRFRRMPPDSPRSLHLWHSFCSKSVNNFPRSAPENMFENVFLWVFLHKDILTTRFGDLYMLGKQEIWSVSGKLLHNQGALAHMRLSERKLQKNYT